MPPSQEKWSGFSGETQRRKYIWVCKTLLCMVVGHQSSFLQCNWGQSLAPWWSYFVFMHFPYLIYNAGVCIIKNVYLLRILLFSKALMWKTWHTIVDTTPFQDRVNRLSSMSAKIWDYLTSCYYNLVSAHGVCVCADSFRSILYGILLGFCLCYPPFHHVKSPDSFGDWGVPRDQMGY